MATDIILAELQKISARLSVIEGKIGGGSGSAAEEGERSRLATDFEASISNGVGKAAVDAARAIGGPEGEKLVRACSRADVVGVGRVAAFPLPHSRAPTPRPSRVFPHMESVLCGSSHSPAPTLQAAVISAQLSFVVRVLDMAGACKKPAKEVRG